MNQTAILWPMVAHALLVFIVYGVLGVRRTRAVTSGEAKVNQFKNRTQEPDSSFTAANNIMNQFEAPTLFHIVCLALYVTAGVSTAVVTFAWLFIVARYVHAYIHLTSNRVKYRSWSFRTSLGMILLLWVWFTLHLAGM